MKAFTRYKKNDNGAEVRAVFWDGSYDIYTYLVHEEPNFVGVLDDSGRRGDDKVKLWNESKKTWEVCPRGNYIVKTENEIFTVKTKEELLSEASPIR
jgi:hypothetical protein